MDEQKVQPISAPPVVPPLTIQPKPKKVYETDLRDRVMLVLAVLLGTMLMDMLLSTWTGYPSLSVTVLVLCWEGVMLWYAGVKKLWTPENLLLTLSVLLLATVFTFWANRWFYYINLLFLPLLMTVQMFSLFGKVSYSWSRPLMLLERGYLLLEGLCFRWEAAIHAVKGAKGGPSKRFWYVLAGLAVAIPLVLLVLPLLITADALFDKMAGEAVRFLCDSFGDLAVRLLFGALLAPFLFGLLYALRRPTEAKLGLEKWTLPLADPAMALTFLAVLDALYLFFMAVQFRGLFGGEAYLKDMGLSLAEYARSGFFQLVWVTAINLTVVLLAVQFTKREGTLWTVARGLCTLMVALSGLMLASAAVRMTLYVREYGLSFKRFLTYWGMAMLAIFLVAALLKIWKKDFGFFRVLFAAGLAGWLVLNLCNVDYWVARYNVENYLAGNLSTLDVEYLTLSSYDALAFLERLPGDTQVLPLYPNPTWEDGRSGDASYPGYDLSLMIEDRRAKATAEVSSWQTWTVSAYLASRP